ncbi:hypothetical protein M1555_04355 [Patescibacteria group bacterium]|nr:hypothetical protein [Patescibacteria group bacterium]
MRILGISCYYHDATAALIEDGRIVAAAAEERFTRIKHDNDFPRNAIRFCLDWTTLSTSSIDAVVFYEKPVLKFERILHQHLAHFPKSRKIFVDTIGSWFDLKLQIAKSLQKEFGYAGRIVYVEQHISHAASSYYLSSFRDAVIVTFDGVGEWATTTVGVGHEATVRVDKEIRFPHSLGLLYSALTAYLGFSVNDAEYKVMGLAAYGDPKPFRQQFNELVRSFPDGSFALNMDHFDFSWADHMFNSRLSKLFGFPPRQPEAPMERHFENIAASLQEKLEEVVFAILTNAHERYRIDNLCLAGGVALNSVMNGKILKRTPFRHVYITPDPGDGGGAIGGALYVWNLHKRKKQSVPFFPLLGPSFPKEQIEDVLRGTGLPYTRIEDRSVFLGTVADHLMHQKIIGWFQGRMEWGPRALGSRSILASAAKPEMKDIINAKVKHRELFRPFAPVVLDRNVKEYFHADKPLSPSAKYMLMVYPFTEKGKKEAPATVHVDGSGRLQVIEREDNPLYYDLIELYGKKTGTPIIINTSFNVRGEPIVCSPRDAVHCFLHTDIDYLVIDRYIVSKTPFR